VNSIRYSADLHPLEKYGVEEFEANYIDAIVDFTSHVLSIGVIPSQKLKIWG
jgi:hypothetical protein